MRESTLEDVPTLVEFNYLMAKETEDKELDRDTLTPGITNFINDPKLGKYYTAEVVNPDGSVQLAGCLFYSIEVQPRLGGLVRMIQSVYVVKEFRSMGIFRKLYTRIIDDAKADEATKAVRLYVETNNEVAIKVYEKMGMAKMGEWDFYEKDNVLSH